jgi:hypothetical protein
VGTFCEACTEGTTIIAGDYKPISEYRAGDDCCGASRIGKVKQVIRRHYKGHFSTVSARGLLPISVTPDHLFSVISRRYSHGQRVLTAPRWVKACDIRPCLHAKRGDYLLTPRFVGSVDVNDLQLSPYTSERGVRVARGMNVPLTFPLNNETAWLLGVYAAEGSPISNAVTFSLGKHEAALASKIHITARHLGYSSFNRTKRTALVVIVPSRILKRAFTAWLGTNAGNKRVPDFMLYHKRSELGSAFLAGYLDGDGYNEVRGGRAPRTTASTVSRTLALQIQFLSIRLGRRCYIHMPKHQASSCIEGRMVNNRQRYNLHLPTNPTRFHSILSAQWLLSPVVGIAQKDYDGQVFDLQTDEETYLMHNALVHNCSPPRIPRYEGRKLVLDHLECYCQCPNTVFESKGPRCPQCHHLVKIELTDEWRDPFLWMDPKTHGPVRVDDIRPGTL